MLLKSKYFYFKSSVLHKLWLRFLHPYLRLWSTWKTDYSFGKPKVTKTEAFSGKFQTAFDPLHGTLFSRNKYSGFLGTFAFFLHLFMVKCCLNIKEICNINLGNKMTPRPVELDCNIRSRHKQIFPYFPLSPFLQCITIFPFSDFLDSYPSLIRPSKY